MIVSSEQIPNTPRQRVTYDNGMVLERQMIYLEARQWENLRRLGMMQQTGVSKVISRLVDIATNFKQPK